MAHVLRLSPNTYIHVLDLNNHISHVETGPLTFTKKDHESVIMGPAPMIIIAPRCYARIRNPAVFNEAGEVQYDEYGNVALLHGEEEIRGHREPFPLYPGEELVGEPSELSVLAPDTALKMLALTDFEDKNGDKRQAGDEWLIRGPGTYFPRVEERVVQLVNAVMIKENQALRLRAKRNFDNRVAGEEWLERTPQMYLVRVEEEQVELITGTTLTAKNALHLKAVTSFVDQFGKKRRAGEEWLVTSSETDCYIPDVQEVLLGVVDATVLEGSDYCVVVNVADPKTGMLQLGKRELRKGPASFFLNPGETLQAGVQQVHVLQSDEALLLQATEEFTAADGTKFEAGAKWMIQGPQLYVPPVHVVVVEQRKAIALSKGEGVYVRDLASGKVQAICGRPHLLKANEELWSKVLPKEIEELVAMGAGSRDQSQRDNVVSHRGDKTRVVSYLVPYNAATQIYDYKKQEARILFGPERVLLGPDEEFTMLSLSGGNPKRADEIKSLCLFLGPDFMTDIVVVETADHARLSLKLAYKWYFEVDRSSHDAAAKLFQVADFVGDSCSAIASKVRGAVAASSFDHFHKNSATIIREAVFEDVDNPRLEFQANGLVINGIDVQSVEPIDSRTRDALQKSVQMAIEITSRSQEAAAKDKSDRANQKAQGELERMIMEDDCKAEKLKTQLLKLHTDTAIIEAIGDQTSDAEARKRAAEIKGQAQVVAATLEAEARSLKMASQLAQFRLEQEVALEVKKRQVELDIDIAKKEAATEAASFAKMVNSIGRDTIAALARAGPELQASLLEGLGLQSYIITDGTGESPINLFNAVSGLTGN